MMRNLMVLCLWLGTLTGYAQKYKAENGYVKFFSEATLEDIAAENRKGASVIDWSNGNLVFSIPIKAFEFEKALMQEHFNENYMESDKYPTAIFRGAIKDFQAEAGTQKVVANGTMTIHGVEQQVSVPGTIDQTTGEVSLKAKFMVKLADYKVKIPKLLWQNIAEEVEVTLDFLYKPIDKL